MRTLESWKLIKRVTFSFQNTAVIRLKQFKIYHSVEYYRFQSYLFRTFLYLELEASFQSSLRNFNLFWFDQVIN